MKILPIYFSIFGQIKAMVNALADKVHLRLESTYKTIAELGTRKDRADEINSQVSPVVPLAIPL